MYIILAFDTEDVYFAPEHRIDDIPGWLADIMTEVGIRGTFFVFGEKAEVLQKRGRQDVLARMARHDIASHQQGNRMPLVPQVVEGRSWQDGLAALRAYEDWVRDRLRSAFGRDPVAFSRHNCYFAPQHVALAGERGLPYMYMIGNIPGSRQPLWYGGALTFPEQQDIFFDGFDRIYSRDEVFARQLAALDAFIAKGVAAGVECAVVFACHPVQVMARGWIEHYTLTTGRERSPRELGWHYAAKPRAEEAVAQANFRKLCVYLKEHPALKVVGIEEAARLFSAQPAVIGRDALVAYAAEVARTGEPAFHPVFSPAELLCGLADSLVAGAAAGDLPESVARRAVLGPVDRPVVAQERDSVTAQDMLDVCRQIAAHVEATGHLPANATLGSARLGVGQALALAAKSYLALAHYDRYDRLSVPCAPRYPRVAYELDAWIQKAIGDHWAMPLDFSCEALAEHARLQTWTMKPAWLSPPQGPVAEGECAARCPAR